MANTRNIRVLKVPADEVSANGTNATKSLVRVLGPYEEVIGRLSETRVEAYYAILVFDASFSVTVPRSGEKLGQLKPGDFVSVLMTGDNQNTVRVKTLESRH